MIVLLSPAKTLDESPISIPTVSQPRLLKSSQTLIDVLKTKDASTIKSLMKISDKLADLNVERYHSFKTPFTEDNAKPSILMFKGDVYTGLAADTFDTENLNFAQKHIRILSGLYGLLKPLDLIQPYRLEMGTALKNRENKNLYEFWGETITDLINEDLNASNSKYLINLASKEYFKSVKPKKVNTPIINIDFKENRDGKLKTIAFNAKKARGVMANLIVKNQLTSLDDLYGLEVYGYLYDEAHSSEHNLCFIK